MITQLTKKENEMTLDYLSRKPLFSIFLVADISKYDYDGNVFKCYGKFIENKIKYIFGMFYKSLIVYSNEDIINVTEILEFLKTQHMAYDVIIAEKTLAEQFTEQINFTNVHTNYLMELTKENFLPVSYEDVNIMKATQDDLDALNELLNSIDEFKGLMNPDYIKEFIDYGDTYLIKIENRIVSCILCSAKTKTHCNIGTVCTRKENRGCGYAAKMISFICDKFLNEGINCSLSYDNPNAGAIYKKIGFESRGNINICIK